MADLDASLGTLEKGIQWVETEHRLLRAEWKALESFAARLETIEPETVSRSSSGPGVMRTLGSTGGSSGSQLAAVRGAYRETVMNTDHYDTEYGESLEQNVYNELGSGLAEALHQDLTLTAPVYHRFRTATADAVKRRKRVLELLATECDGLRTVHTALVPARKKLEEVRACQFQRWTTAALHAEYDRIEEFQGRCEELATERQRARREHVRKWSALPDRTVTEGYLYQPLDTSNPGLAAIAVVADRLQVTAQELDIALLGRDSSSTNRDGNQSASPSM